MRDDKETKIEITDSNDQALRVGATLKVWIAIAIFALSIGSSMGIFAYQQREDHKSIVALEERVGKYPDPNKVPDKEVLGVELKNIQDSLKRIEDNVAKLDGKITKHQEDTITGLRQARKAQ